MTNDKDFRTVDKGTTFEGGHKDLPGDEAAGYTRTGAGHRGPQDDFPGTLNFSTFIISLTTSMLVNLGELPDPVTNTKSINLPLAKQTISIIEMLRNKTTGNLTADEERLIDHVLYDLRMKYVNLATKSKS
jgi:hypothetical protein